MNERNEKIAAVVVNHDAGELLTRCVTSLRRAGISEVVVVDNASSDGSLQRLAGSDEEAILVPTGRNLGYGSGANIGVRRTSAPYVLICNPDLVVEKDAPVILVDALEADVEIGAIGPQILDASGTRYPSVRSFPSLSLGLAHAIVGLFWPTNRWSTQYRLGAERLESIDRVQQVDWVSGACVAVRRDAFDSVGGFDERYFMYVEDLDLCWRLCRAGWIVGYEPKARVVHEQGVSASNHPVKMLVAHHVSTWRFASISLRGARRLVLPGIAVILGLRCAMAIMVHEYQLRLRQKIDRIQSLRKVE